ncbi:hypothetical protein Ciccas_011980 [Cichlidogyrus casuarinus]|uniref:Uncharacterized protein n=1 Tax=Cichlidogyrus casuarinus TaxID=1844966 RepID=A0ABD2PQE6_9PLAT
MANHRVLATKYLGLKDSESKQSSIERKLKEALARKVPTLMERESQTEEPAKDGEVDQVLDYFKSLLECPERLHALCRQEIQKAYKLVRERDAQIEQLQCQEFSFDLADRTTYVEMRDPVERASSLDQLVLDVNNRLNQT